MKKLILIGLVLTHFGAGAVQYQCFFDEDCLQDEYCENRQCFKYYPQDNRASLKSQNCWSDNDCAPEQFCNDGVCMENWPCGLY